LRPYTRTSFHHQPEAQHPKSSAIHKLVGRLSHLWVQTLANCDVRVTSVHPSISDMMLQHRERRKGPQGNIRRFIGLI
jgi:hypothetical protein